ncbi:MAG TPA: hypothetical protein DDZ88_05700 [Verrucomicrobiales bacterium]|nr:hypothetical protein [Verrucomicrobiales bacterium]
MPRESSRQARLAGPEAEKRHAGLSRSRTAGANKKPPNQRTGGLKSTLNGKHADSPAPQRHEQTRLLVPNTAPVASPHYFSAIMDSVPVLVWVSDTKKFRTWFNKPWLEFVGRTLEQELGNGWVENVHPDDLDRCLTIYTTSFDEREPFEMTYRLLRHDGECRWLLDKGIPLHDEDQKFTGYIGSCVDITDRKLAETALRTKEAQLWLIMENTPVMLTQCSRDLTYTFANRAYSQMLRLEPERLIGRPILEVVGREAFELIRPRIEQVLRGERVEFDADLPCPQAGRRTVHVVY